jgi:hypothetical protein
VCFREMNGANISWGDEHMTEKKHRHGIAVLLIVVLCIVPGFNAVSAQPAPGPIIMTTDGDLWAWNGAGLPLTQLTGWGRNGGPVLSPDGTRAAYLSVSSIFVDWAQKQTGGGGGYYVPENIWMLDIPSGHTFRIADQPEDAVWDGPNNPGRYILRSSPSWSPDGQQLAWLDLQIDTITFTSEDQIGTAQVVVHDLVSGTVHVLDSFPITSVVTSGVRDVEWGRPGIAVKIGVGDDAYPWDLRVYNLAGDLIAQNHFEDWDYSVLFGSTWIQEQDQDYLFNAVNEGTWLNWRTGQTEAMSGLPEMYSLSAPDGASFYLSGDTWYLVLPGQAPINLGPVNLGDAVRPFGISRDGQAVVYGRWEIDPSTGFHAYTIIVHYPDHQVEIGRIQSAPGVVWGPVGWRVRH